jgi:hypothetical protein
MSRISGCKADGGRQGGAQLAGFDRSPGMWPISSRDGSALAFACKSWDAVLLLPGASTAHNQGTFATGINEAGAIVGYYDDAAEVFHGFLLTP